MKTSVGMKCKPEAAVGSGMMASDWCRPTGGPVKPIETAGPVALALLPRDGWDLRGNVTARGHLGGGLGVWPVWGAKRAPASGGPQ